MPEAKLFNAQEYAILARAQVGKPYVLGANGPDKFDCSGLVIWLNNQSGAFLMGDDTAAGIYNRTKPVTGTPTVGDLVFLKNNPARSNGIGHIAVITSKLSNGDWEIIEARGRAYGVVKTTLSYWKTRKYYTGVRRLPSFKLTVWENYPPPPKITDVTFALSTFNCSDPRFGDKMTTTRKSALVKAVKAAKSDFYCLTEAPEPTRNFLRAGMPGGSKRWKVWERVAQAIMFDSDRWEYTSSVKVRFGPTDYHGGVIATFTDKKSRQKVTVGAYHLPPNVVASDGFQKNNVTVFEAEMRKLTGVRVMGGDGMDESAWARDWLDARSKATKSSTRNDPTYKEKSVTDRVHTDPLAPVQFDEYAVQEVGKASDHDLVKVACTIKLVSTT